MLRHIVLILQVLSITLGVFLIVTRVFLFEKTQGILQSRIEDLWIKADDYQQFALSKHNAFMQVVAGMMTKMLDLTFGPKLISMRSFIVSCCYAFATFFVAVSLLMRYGSGYWDTDLILYTELHP